MRNLIMYQSKTRISHILRRSQLQVHSITLSNYIHNYTCFNKITIRLCISYIYLYLCHFTSLLYILYVCM